MKGGDKLIGRAIPNHRQNTWHSFVYLGESPNYGQDDYGHDDMSEKTEPGITGSGITGSGITGIELVDGTVPERAIATLATVTVGDRVRIVALNGDANARLMAMGLMPGVVLQVVSCTPNGSVIVALPDQRLGLGAEMAQQIQVVDAVAPMEQGRSLSSHPPAKIAPEPAAAIAPTLKLRNVPIGSTWTVVGYEPTARDYKRKLLAMGLTPGTALTVKRHAPLGDPTEIEVRGFRLSLRKHEADALIVEPIKNC